MKKGPLHFLGRKNHSLFDTNVKMKDMDNMEFVLGSTAIPESGTASVRARPTVKHHASTESFQGFAVPTPTVPLLPQLNGPKTNGSVSGDRMSNGWATSVPDLVEGEIFVPPPPSIAPPPPPLMVPPPPPMSFIPPPPDFMGDLNSPDLAALQPPSMPPPKPTFLPPSTEEQDPSLLKPPPMAPPKPPSTCSSGSASSLSNSSLPPTKVPEPPKFAPPQLPTEKQHKTHKTPPPKPIRLSSVSSLDSPPQTPAPPPPVQAPTLSTFNPQNTAKLYNESKTTFLGGYEGHDARPKQMLLLEDSGSVNPVPVLVQVDGKAHKGATPPKPVPKDVIELKESLKMTQPSQILPSELNVEAKTETVSARSEMTKLPQSPQLQKVTGTQVNSEKVPSSPQLQKVTGTQVNSEKVPSSPQLQKVTSTQVNSETTKDKLIGSPSQSRSFSPMLDHKLRNLKANEINGAREGPAASPLALLMAAKEREKHRSAHSLSREGSTKKDEEPSRIIHPSDSSPNSSVIPKSGSSSSRTVTEERIHKSDTLLRPIEHPNTIQTPEKTSSLPSNSPALSRNQTASSPVVSPSVSQAVQHDVQKEEFNVLLLPPPPEFDDLGEITEPPPSICPPDPPGKKAAILAVAPRAPAPAPAPALAFAPSPALAPAPAFAPAPAPPPPPPPPPPQLPPSDIDIKPKLQVQTKPKLAPSQLPPALSPSQATLLSILQKKMLEMDQKMAPAKEAESTSEDWGTTLSDEDNKVPVAVRVSPQSKNYPAVNKAATLDMRELENKVLKKYQENSQVKFPTSNGPHSKNQFGKTFTIRPGTKQPITLVTKED